MAESSRTIMTDAGFALETRVRADETKMQFTRAAISTDDHFSDTDDALAKLTELSNIQQDGKVTAVQVINTTTVYVQVDVNQAESKADYQMRSAALYAKDDDGTEVLYGVTVLQDPVFVHKDADGSYLGFGINTTVGRASNVVVVVDPANMVTQQVFESTMKNYYTKAEVDAKFVTDDDFASKLPKNIATTDAANTFAKSQTLAGGATDGKGNAYATTKDVATDLNNGLNTKVTDNKNGTEQLNGAQVQPYNKLSDTIGGRNLLKGTAKCDFTSSSNGGTQTVEKYDDETNYIQNTSNTPTDRMGPWFPLMPEVGQVYTFSADVCGNGYIPRGNFHYEGGDDGSLGQVDLTNDWQRISNTFRVNTDIGQVNWIMYANNSTLLKVKHIKVEKGSVATDWCPNPEDKVNVSDMRKPANQVASIDEVNAKQDKIGYTPADDSEVLHNSGLAMMPNDNSALVVGNNGDIGLVKQIRNSGSFAVGAGNSFHVVQSNNSSIGIADTFHDMFRINGNYQISLGPGAYFTPADDSKVAHLSGANNFDTVPTVNNNPLLLASSLPSDLARTSQQTNFTDGLQKGGKDVATVDDVSAKQDKLEYTPANAANVVDRNPNTGVVSTPTDFTKLTVNGGKSVATSDDLKSLEDSAWRPIISNNYSGLCMMRYNADTETMSLSGTIFPKTYSTEGSRVAVIIPLPDGFSMGENADSKTTLWSNVSNSVQLYDGVIVDLKFESDGVHIVFDKMYANRISPAMFIVLDGFFSSSIPDLSGSSFINFKVNKN